MRRSRTTRMIVAGLLALAVLLLAAGCVGVSAPGSGNCHNGVCVHLELAEPVSMGAPIPVTITVQTDQDESRLTVSLGFSAADMVVEGARAWTVDAKAHQSLRFSTVIRFPSREGSFGVHAGTLTHQGGYSEEVVNVRLTHTGAVLNPTRDTSLRGRPPPELVIQSSVTPLPSMCGNTTTVVAAPSDEFRFRILVKDSRGAPAPGVLVTLAFVEGYDIPPFPPLPLRSDEHGYAVYKLAREKLIASQNAYHESPGHLFFGINASWPDAPSGPEVLYLTCGGQDFDPIKPLDILVTIQLSPEKK